MKKSKLFIISLITLAFAISGMVAYAFYNFFYRNNGSTLSLVEVVFSVNDSNVKNTNDVVYFSTDDMSQGDGYEMVLNYSINGSFSSTNAVKYSTYFQTLTGGVDGDRDITNGVEVYRFDGEHYVYVNTLNNLISSTTPIMTDYLGSLGTNKEKFMLVYGEATVVENRVPFGLQISTTSEVVTTDATNFPYYYLANLGKNSAESILEQLPKNTSVYGRTIVLTKDIDYHGSDITFEHVVGIDLNGHSLNLNGAKITIKDTQNGSEPFETNLAIIDSKNRNEILNGSIVLNLSNTVLDVDTGLLNYVTVSNINMNVFKERMQNSLNEIASQKRLMNTENDDTFSYQFDALGGLKFYAKKGTVNISIQGSDEYVSYDSANCIFNVTGLDTSNIVYVAITALKNSVPYVANANLSLYGKSLQDAAEYLMNYVPKVIDGSIYLPQYLPKFNAYVTWISFDDDLINSNGTVIQNGYVNLDSWVSKTTKLGFVLDQSGEIKNGIINDITIQVLSEEERAELLHDHSITMFDYETVTSYSFDTIDVLLHKRDVDYTIANEALFNKIKEIALNEFGISLETLYSSIDSIDAIKTEFKTKLFDKLGLESITVDAVNEASLYVTNELNSDRSITSVRQISIPKDTVDLVYKVNYKFKSGNTVTENKTIDVSNGEATTTATDVSNTIRVPFDTYTRTMTNPISTGPYVYESFIDTFEIVSNFSGAQIEYRVDDEFKNYVEIITTGEGESLKKYVHILTSKSPAETTDVKVYYTIGDVTNYVTFKLVGVLHNGIEIKDANLYVELLANFDNNKDNILTILEAEHAEGNTFDWSNKGIVSLQGLRYFTNIEKLYLIDNKLIDIDDLAYLKKLTYFEARNNYITDISCLKYLDNLETVHIRNNQVTDISALQYLTKLKKVCLEFNKISDFSYIQNLPNVEELRVFNNYNSDGSYTVSDGDDSGDDYIDNLTRANKYYLALLKAKRGNNTCDIFITNYADKSIASTYDKPSAFNFSNDMKQEALVLSKIVTISEVNNVISLPTYINNSNANYEITYFTDESNKNYIDITRDENNGNKVTNITINQIPVDNEVSIYAYTIGLAGLRIYRKITFVILEGDVTGQIELKDENDNTFMAYANVVIPDLKLRAALFRNFDAINDGTITYDELTASNKELNLEYVGVKSLQGLQYFTGITKLNLRGNVFDDANDLWYVSFLQSLTDLKIDGQEFDYDNLVYFSIKDKASYNKSNTNTFEVKDATANSHNVVGTYGLTSLTTLNVNGSYNLDSDEAKTELYHVYLNNSVSIYKQDDTTVWDPIKEEVSKLIGSMTTSATFVNLYDQIQIAQKYKFYLYDDLIPTGFTLSYTNPGDTYFRNKYAEDVPALYYFADNANSTTQTPNFKKDVNFSEYDKIDMSKLFSSGSGSNVLTIKYVRLSAFDLTTYANMGLKSDKKLWNNKTITESTINYSLALKVQYNDMYKLYNDIDTSDSINENGGTTLNKVFGSIETMIYVMCGVTSQLYGKYDGVVYPGNGTFDTNYALKPFYYTVTDVNGNLSYYYKYGNNQAELCENKEDAISRVRAFETSGTVDYGAETPENKKYKDGFIVYVSQLKKNFKYNTNGTIATYFKFNPTYLSMSVKLAFADTVTEGLQYLEAVEGIAVSNGMKYGDGHSLVNAKVIFDVYGYANITTITTPLPKLEVWAVNTYFMTDFAFENGMSDGNPEKLLETYFVYMPNLRTFYARSNPESGMKGTPITDWSAFLAYAYIPYEQTIDLKFNSSGSLDMDDALIGGMQLQDNKLYYYDSAQNVTMDNRFKIVYNSSGRELDVTDFDRNSLTNISGDYYSNLYDNNGNKLSNTIKLFRKSQQNQLNYIALGSGGVNTGTINQKLTFTQAYYNAKESVKAWYYLLMGTNGLKKDAEVSKAITNSTGFTQSDWVPDLIEVKYIPTSALEWSEFKKYIAHLDVTLTGTTYNGNSLSNTNYDDINWNSVEYVDMFKSGLKVSLPTKVTDFLTGGSDFDDYRDFDIEWRLTKLNSSNKPESITIDSTNSTLNGSKYEYLFTTEGYYILSTIINGDDTAGLMYAFTITDKIEANFNQWYEKIKDKTLKFFAFCQGGSEATTISKTDISVNVKDASNNVIIKKDLTKRYLSSVYSLEGIETLTKLKTLELQGFSITSIPTLPSTIEDLNLADNLIDNIGDILDGSKYLNLKTVDVTDNYLNLKESNFKNGSYYTTNIESLKIYGVTKNFYIDSTQLTYFTELTYAHTIEIHFQNEIIYDFGPTGALTKESLDGLYSLVKKTNVTVYFAKGNRWDSNEVAVDSSTISKLVDAYDAVLNPKPTDTVSITNGTINISSAYRLDTTKNVEPTVSMVWSGNNGNLNYYQKMVTPYYQVFIDYNGYKVVKELHGRFYANTSAQATLNGVSIETLQSNMDHRMLELLYSYATFDEFSGSVNVDTIDVQDKLFSPVLDFKGFNNFQSIKHLTNYYGGNFISIRNISDSSIESIYLTPDYVLLREISDSNSNVDFTFINYVVSRDLVYPDSNGDLITSFSKKSISLIGNQNPYQNPYNYIFVGSNYMSNLKTQIYNEIIGNENALYYNHLGFEDGYASNLTRLHAFNDTKFYNATLGDNSAFSGNSFARLVRELINVDTNSKRTYNNGTYLHPTELGRRYTLLKIDGGTSSEFHFPASIKIMGETLNLNYSSSNSELSLTKVTGSNSYYKMTPGTITENVDGIEITVTYSSTKFNGSVKFKVDVKSGKNSGNDNYSESITSWYVEMQDGTLVPAVEVFSSAVLTANIFNGIPRVTFSTEVTTTFESANISESYDKINGNLIMDEVEVNGVLSKVLRQSVISQIKSINVYDRALMYFEGLEIFYNCKSIQLCDPGHGAVAYDFSFASNMQLENFIFYSKRNSITVQDFSFLNNSRDTLKNIQYGMNNATNNKLPFEDMSWLLSFNALESVILSGPSGIQNNPTFQYFLTAMYLKHHKDIVTYKVENGGTTYTYSNLNISDYIKSAATIMYNLSSFDTSNDSSFIYQNGFELYSKDGKIEENKDYYITSYLYSAGDYYKIEWNSLSSFVDISVIHNNSVITVVEYENLYKEWKLNNPNSSDYDFCKDYQIKIRFKNLASATSYKAFISMKIEYESKFSDVYTPVMSTISDMATNYANYYKTSYSSLNSDTEFIKNKYYYKDGNNYKLLLIKPSDWDTNTSNYYDKVYTSCVSGETYNKNITYYTRYVYEPHMFERILTINLAKNNKYKQVLIDNDAYSHADYVKNNSNIYDGTAISGNYTSVVSSNPSVIEVVEHNVNVAETRYFIKTSDNKLINVNANNYQSLVAQYGENTVVYYYFVGRVCAGVGHDKSKFYSYDKDSYTYTLLDKAPSDWSNTSTNYYSFTKFADTKYQTTLGALISISSDFKENTKVYGIYLKDPDYEGLVTITCTLSDGTTEEYYVYWER